MWFTANKIVDYIKHSQAIKTFCNTFNYISFTLQIYYVAVFFLEQMAYMCVSGLKVHFMPNTKDVYSWD